MCLQKCIREVNENSISFQLQIAINIFALKPEEGSLSMHLWSFLLSSLLSDTQSERRHWKGNKFLCENNCEFITFIDFISKELNSQFLEVVSFMIKLPMKNSLYQIFILLEWFWDCSYLRVEWTTCRILY